MTEKQLLRKQRNEKIAVLYLQGRSFDEIGAMFGLKRQMLEIIFAAQGFVLKRHPQKRSKLTAEKKLWKSELNFWSRAALTADADRCWEWLGKVSRVGYPRIGWNGKIKYARRIAWLIWNGEEPTSSILNRCGNPICINPNHLIEGSGVQKNKPRYLTKTKAERK